MSDHDLQMFTSGAFAIVATYWLGVLYGRLCDRLENYLKEKKMIKPTVGRVVWFYPKGEADKSPLAAIIACVWSDTCVNLVIFDRNGNAMLSPPTSILLVQEGNERPSGGHFCEWMPFQKGQAAKTEALEMSNAQLAS